MSDLIEFGFDDAKIVKATGVDQLKLSRSGEVARVSVISFKRFHDVALANKAREVGRPLTDAEKHEYNSKIDAKLSEQLKKPVDQLTEVDRLDIKNPRFTVAYTHYKDGLGTIRCLSKWEGGVCVQPDTCCNKIGDPEQTVGTVVLQYPLTSDGDVDEELLKQRKMTGVYVYKMSSKKFKRLESAYKDAREDKRLVIDVKIKLDGDPKYAKHEISASSNAVWAREETGPSVRAWVLDQGLRSWKYVTQSMGFEMKREMLLERLGGGGNSSNAQLGSGSSSSGSAAPVTNASYDDMLA